jgi:hypothetical protein
MATSRISVGLGLVACALGGLLAASAACGGKDESSVGQTAGSSGSESVAGQSGGADVDASDRARADAAMNGEPDAAHQPKPEPEQEIDAAVTEIDASVPTACDLECAAGERCELVQVTCIRAPCPPQPSCVKAEPTSCDPRQILCRRAPPECPQWHVPSVSGTCFGPCVPLEQCACDEPADCPNPETFTCHMSAAHCGPYVN